MATAEEGEEDSAEEGEEVTADLGAIAEDGEEDSAVIVAAGEEDSEVIVGGMVAIVVVGEAVALVDTVEGMVEGMVGAIIK